MILPSDQSGFRQRSAKSGAIAFAHGQTYWVEHPKFGTIKATLALAGGPNLLFKLEQEIAVPFDGGGTGPFAQAGMMVTTMLPITNDDGGFTCFMTGKDRWKIYDQEPAVKLPTK